MKSKKPKIKIKKRKRVPIEIEEEPQPEPQTLTELQQLAEDAVSYPGEKLHVATRRFKPDAAPITVSAWEFVRVRMLATLMNEGVDEMTAMWAVASHPKLGVKKYRGRGDDPSARPNEIHLRRMVATLISRTTPEIMEQCRAQLQLRMAQLGGNAMDILADVICGPLKRKSQLQQHQMRINAATKILDALNIDMKQANAGVQVNVQTNMVLNALTGILDTLDGKDE